LLLAAWPAAAAATLSVYAPQMTVARERGAVVLTFPAGLRAASSEGYTISAGYGRVRVSSAGFAPLPERAEAGERAAEEKLPELPRARLSVSNLRELYFSGQPTLRSREYTVTAGSLASGDGGQTWRLAGGVEFRPAESSGLAASARSLTFSRASRSLTTADAVTLSGFAEGAGKVTLSSPKTRVDLANRTAALSGGAEFAYGEYRLTSDSMTIDLERRVLHAEGSPRFSGRGSELSAATVSITFGEGEVSVEAAQLQGYLQLPS